MPQTVTSALFMVLFKKSKTLFKKLNKNGSYVTLPAYIPFQDKGLRGALSIMCVLPQLIIKYFEDIGQIFVQNPSVGNGPSTQE